MLLTTMRKMVVDDDERRDAADKCGSRKAGAGYRVGGSGTVRRIRLQLGVTGYSLMKKLPLRRIRLQGPVTGYSLREVNMWSPARQS
ncbi:hypothetical protein LR48_Vigan08g123800 [Vigna angularis]|uniref:Uncharacterized protein n=1 Tax=Phaseolus angularis TaxID=3914 RepID=A0A0L9V5T8_PHAAN|nr:hypothetical protein LR48_Vigan08g123800 [Vigna angularis]